MPALCVMLTLCVVLASRRFCVIFLRMFYARVCALRAVAFCVSALLRNILALLRVCALRVCSCVSALLRSVALVEHKKA